jgi:cytochrome c
MEARWIKLSLGAIAIISALAVASATKPNVSRGRELFEKRCTGCHALDRAKVGPPLRGAFGRGAARDGRYPYSDALTRARLTWDEPTLDKWLVDPEVLVPGNDMPFRLEDPTERADIIAYLKHLGDK